MAMSLAALNPNTKASYSVMLLVVSNSCLYESVTTSFEGEMRTIPALELSFEDDPSNYIFHTSFPWSTIG
jgi:hypothetical protein